MIGKTILAAAGAATLLSAAGVSAQDFEPVTIERVRDRDDVQLNPASAYLLVQGPPTGSYIFVKNPTEEQRADWEAQRVADLTKAQGQHERRMRTYEANMRRYKPGPNALPPPVEPVYPTDATFTWPALESRATIAIGPNRDFNDEGDETLWLYEVPAGEYTFYGHSAGVPVGTPVGVDCACMGSVSFAVEPGKVTALRIRRVTVDGDNVPFAGGEGVRGGRDDLVRRSLVVAEVTPEAYDPRIPREMIVQAEFTPVQYQDNWSGGTINRIQPIPGVLEYDRDRVVDLRSGG